MVCPSVLNSQNLLSSQKSESNNGLIVQKIIDQNPVVLKNSKPTAHCSNLKQDLYDIEIETFQFIRVH